MSNEVVSTALHEVVRTCSRKFDPTQQSDVNTPAGIRTYLLTRFTERPAHRGSLDHPLTKESFLLPTHHQPEWFVAKQPTSRLTWKERVLKCIYSTHKNTRSTPIQTSAKFYECFSPKYASRHAIFLWRKDFTLPEIQKFRDNAHYHFYLTPKIRVNDSGLILSRTSHHGMPK
jgi:hypothetical protein